MSRNLSSAMVTAVAASTVQPLLLFEALFGSTTVRYWTGIGTLEWNSYSWQGVGTLIDCSPVEESDDVKAQGITLKVKGVSSADVAVALDEIAGGAAGSIRLGLLAPDDVLGDPATGGVLGDPATGLMVGSPGGGMIADPKIIFRGRLDVGEIDDSNPEEPIIVLSYENELIDLERPREWRFTDEAQTALHADDTALRWIAGLQDQELVWGRRG